MSAAISHNPQPPRGAALRLADILVRAGVLDANGVRMALARLAANGGWLGEHVVALGLADAGQLAEALAQATRAPRVILARHTPEPAALEKLERAFCEEHRCLPLALREAGTSMVLAMADPTDAMAAQEASRRSGCAIRPVVATEAEIAVGLAAALATRSSTPNRGISFHSIDDDDAPMVTESLAGSLVEHAPANDPVGFTPARLRTAPGAGHELVAEPAPTYDEGMAQRLAATESELRRTQQMVRALVQVVLERGLVSREELAALARGR